MTCGIYALYWEEPDLIYIGLSQTIEGRFKEHTRDMIRGDHSNYLIQKTYNKYGEPNMYHILEECSMLELNNREIYWTNEFDALNSKVGLCIVEPGKVGWGTRSNASKYSKWQILRVFSLLYQTSMTCDEIALKCMVNSSLPTDIKREHTHLWLKDIYSSQYNKMLSRPINRTKGVVRGREIVSPEGTTYILDTNLTEFCKIHDTLNHSPHSSGKGIGKVIRGSRKSYLGWKLK